MLKSEITINHPFKNTALHQMYAQSAMNCSANFKSIECNFSKKSLHTPKYSI